MQIELDSSAHTGIKMHQTSFSDPSGLWTSQHGYCAKIPGTPSTEYRIFFQISVQKLAYFRSVYVKWKVTDLNTTRAPVCASA